LSLTRPLPGWPKDAEIRFFVCRPALTSGEEASRFDTDPHAPIPLPRLFSREAVLSAKDTLVRAGRSQGKDE